MCFISKSQKIKNLEDELEKKDVRIGYLKHEVAKYSTQYDNEADYFFGIISYPYRDKKIFHSMDIVEDTITGKPIYIKNSIPVIELSPDGRIDKIGYTMDKPDKGFNYKLVRNK